MSTSQHISRIRRSLDQDSCHHIVRSLVLSRLDYGNALSRLDYSNALLLGINQTDLTLKEPGYFDPSHSRRGADSAPP